MASRSTSIMPPAYLSAIARASTAISGASTGSGDTTFSMKASFLPYSVVSTRSSRYPSTSCPANLTRTRQPGTAAPSSSDGTE